MITWLMWLFLRVLPTKRCVRCKDYRRTVLNPFFGECENFGETYGRGPPHRHALQTCNEFMTRNAYMAYCDAGVARFEANQKKGSNP